MGLILLGAVAGALSGGIQARAQSRFMSYGSEAQCVAGHVIADAICRSAFASAKAEFEAKTASFPSLAQCARSYGDCAAWPPGTTSKASFRPRWDGVDIVDTPHERSVTPAAAGGSKRLRFAALPLALPSEARELVVRGPGRIGGRSAPRQPMPPANARAALARPAGSPAHPTQGRAESASARASAPPPPGSGFKLDNGVLTYPAPARFQPQNLPKPP